MLEILHELVNDQYGNYIIQQVLKLNLPDINYQIMHFLCSNLTYFCKQKISSNVVECAVKVSTPVCQILIFDLLISNRQIFTDIITNEFGNYVIYAIIVAAKENQETEYFEEFISIFKKNIDRLKKLKFGKKFIQKVN